MENGVEIIGTIITDVDRNAEKIVLPKYVEGTLWNMSRKGRVGCCRIYPCRGKRQTDPYKKFVENFTFL